jgi:hypothetical protein
MQDPRDVPHDDLTDDAVDPACIVDRREVDPEEDPDALRSGLSRAQLDTLDTMESFRWRLAFVRWPVFKAPIPVLFNRDGSRYVVINEDGSLDERQTLQLRQ